MADRFVFLSVGGIEPRKGSVFLFEAMAITGARARSAAGPGGRRRALVPGLHRATATTCSRLLPGLGLELGRDVILAGTVSDAELHEWYRSADALAFPSLKEGWGLAVLEAMAADLPVVSSDIAVLREYLTPDRDRGDDPGRGPGVAGGGHAPGWSPTAALRETLIRGGRELVPAFSWERAADEHARLYADDAAAAWEVSGAV